VTSHHRGHRPVVMAIHAHPDDESSQTGGTLARYSALGYRTVLVTCTDGSLGDAVGGIKPGESGHDPHTIAHHRAGELDRAAAALGITDVVKLAYPDSGFGGAPAGAAAFSELPLRPLIGAMARVMRLFRPDVVLTYPPNGLSEHPDHIRTHDVVMAAHSNIVASADWGDPAAPGPRLYYIALSQSQLDRARDAAREAMGEQAWLPPDSLAAYAAAITTVIDVSEYWEHKLQALAAHASQSDAALLLGMFTMIGSADPEARTEEYVRVYPPPADTVEDDFFDLATGLST
jgi:LmbE family N-acetylglucosaminyl deacetylase